MIDSSHTDKNLLERAIRNAVDRRKRKGEKHPRWVAVMDLFALGSTTSRQICAHYGLDPDEMVKR